MKKFNEFTLAEVGVSSTMGRVSGGREGIDKKTAFTLAEVLITLGIIGVVMALSMPTLIQKHRKQITVNRLKKAYSTISNLIKLSETENGDYLQWDTSIGAVQFFKKYIKPYANGADVCTSLKQFGFSRNSKSYNYATGQPDGFTVFSQTTRVLFKTSDGMFIWFLFQPSATGEKRIMVDINGQKGPNTACKDFFVFGYFDNNTIKGIYNAANPSGGYQCAKMIMENNWQIPENYPVRF